MDKAMKLLHLQPSSPSALDRPEIKKQNTALNCAPFWNLGNYCSSNTNYFTSSSRRKMSTTQRQRQQQQQKTENLIFIRSNYFFNIVACNVSKGERTTEISYLRRYTCVDLPQGVGKPRGRQFRTRMVSWNELPLSLLTTSPSCSGEERRRIHQVMGKMLNKFF